MTRLLPLLPLILWLTWNDRDGAATASLATTPTVDQWFSLVWMFGGLLAIVATMVTWARFLLHTHRFSYAAVPTRGFNYAMLAARLAGIAWYGVALYLFDYGELIATLLRPLESLNIRLPGILAATAPSVLTWFGLAWAAYPVDRTTREQNLLVEINAGLTPRAPPTLGQSLSSNFRFQVLFILSPVLAVVALKDIVSLGFHFANIPQDGHAESFAFIACSLFVFVASPELLVRVLRARPLGPSPLRSRLQELAARLNLRYRDILIWHTSYGIGNAAVMGLVPRFRYILLTDLLIETLDDDQIEAVFAHEAGHVKHRHLLWYVAFWAMFLLSLTGPADTALAALIPRIGLTPTTLSLIISAIALSVYLALFGLLSRMFERQADVFAARSIQSMHPPIDTPDARRSPLATPVGSIGAESFVSALQRVAEISHRPITRTPTATLVGRIVDVALNFTHPSIPDRIDHLRELAMLPALTTRFDRKVVRVMFVMLLLLMTLSTWAIIEQIR